MKNLKNLLKSVSFIKGSLNKVYYKRAKKPFWYLTYKKNKKTVSVYIPPSLVSDVMLMIKNYKEIKSIIDEFAEKNLKELKTRRLKHVKRRKKTK